MTDPGLPLTTPAAEPQSGSTGAAGSSHPIGATLTGDGVNFSVYAKQATALELLLFAQPSDDQPAQVIALDPELNRTGPYWHVFVPGLRAGQVYGFHAYGPSSLSSACALTVVGSWSTPTAAGSPCRRATDAPSATRPMATPAGR